MQTVQKKGSFVRATRRRWRLHIHSLQQLVTEVHRTLRLQPRLQHNGSRKASRSAMRPPHIAA